MGSRVGEFIVISREIYMRYFARIFFINIIFFCSTLFAMQRNLWWHNGNCYMNAVLNSLYFVPSFREAILQANLSSLNCAMTQEEYEAARQVQWIFKALNGSIDPYFLPQEKAYLAYCHSRSHKIYSYGIVNKLDNFLQKAKDEYFSRRLEPSEEDHFALCRAVLGSMVPKGAERTVVRNFINRLSLLSFGVYPLVVVPLLGAVFRKIECVDRLWHFSLAANLPFYQIVAQGHEGSLQAAVDNFFENYYVDLKMSGAPKVLVVAVIADNSNTEFFPATLSVPVGQNKIAYKIRSVVLGSDAENHAISFCFDISNAQFYVFNSHDSVGPGASVAGSIGPASQALVNTLEPRGYKPVMYFFEQIEQPVFPACLDWIDTVPDQKLVLLRNSLSQLKNKLGTLSGRLGQLKRVTRKN